MKHRLFLTLVGFILFFQNADSQDLIVTVTGDSLNCKILKIDVEKIFFSVMKNHYWFDTFLLNESVTYSEVEFYTNLKRQKNNELIKSISPTRFSLSYGIFYRTAKPHPDLPPEFESLYKDLRIGNNFDVAYHHFIKGKSGIGFRANLLLANGTTDIQTGNFKSSLNDKILVNFFGISYAPRFISNKTIILTQFDLGYLGYKETFGAPINIEYTGGTMGLGFGLHFDNPISEEVALGIGLDLIIGALSSMESDEGETIEFDKGEYEGLTRIGLMFGIRFM